MLQCYKKATSLTQFQEGLTPAALKNGLLFLGSKYVRRAGELFHLGSAQQNRTKLKEQLQCLAFAQRCLVFEMAESSYGHCTLGPGLPDVLGSGPALCVSLLTKSNYRCTALARSFTWHLSTFLKNSMIKKVIIPPQKNCPHIGPEASNSLRFLWQKSLAWKQVSNKNLNMFTSQC